MRKIKFVIIALIFISCSYGYSQSQETEQPMKKKISKEDLIGALEKRIADAGDDYISLTATEYELLLSQPVGEIEGFEPHATAMDGIKIGYGFPEGPKVYKTDIQIIFPNIPNISEGEVFVILDQVKGSNGRDYLDRGSNTEVKADGSSPESDFTELKLYSRTAGSNPYWFGSRYVNLRDPSDNETVRVLGALGGEVELSEVSGKVVMELPVNITELSLSKEDLGKEKSFAGGSITLEEITSDYISFRFTGDPGRLYSNDPYDNANAILEITNVQIGNGLHKLYADHPQSIKIYEAEVIKKEYPFSFGSGHSDAEEKVAPAVQEEVAPAPPIVYLDTNDPIAIAIKGRAISDLRQSVTKSDPEGAESKLLSVQIEAMPKEKQIQLQELFVKSIHDYLVQTHFDVSVFNYGTFLMLFNDLGKMDVKSISSEYDIRVQNVGGNQYAAEFWENSKAHALAAANNPNVEDIEVFKELIRLSGGQKSVSKADGATTTQMVALPYTKMLGLLYSLEKNGSVLFHDPFQPMMDFIKQQ